MLSELIERRGFHGKRQQIVDNVGVSATALSQYVRGRANPSLDRLLALAEFFDVSLDYLVYGELGVARSVSTAAVEHFERATTEIRSQAARHEALVSRISRVLGDRIDGVAAELAASNTAGREGLIQQDECLRVEQYCVRADIVAMHLREDVIPMEREGATVKGPFLDIVARNLTRRIPYRFLLPAATSGQRSDATAFRELLGREIDADYVHEFCEIREARSPLVAGVALYQLNTAAFRAENEMLLAQFARYVSDDGWLGYTIRPNVDSEADMVMEVGHAAFVRGSFEEMWAAGVAL